PPWPPARSQASAPYQASARSSVRRPRPDPRGGIPDLHTGCRQNGRRTTMTATVNESMRNGVDTATLFATIDAVKAAPEAAKFQFRADNEWINGTHSRGTIHGFYGVGEE